MTGSSIRVAPAVTPIKASPPNNASKAASFNPLVHSSHREQIFSVFHRRLDYCLGGVFVEPNEVQLRQMFEALRQELALQWRARYTEILPGGELALSFEHSTNNSWRCLYIIRNNGEWVRREFYV